MTSRLAALVVAAVGAASVIHGYGRTWDFLTTLRASAPVTALDGEHAAGTTIGLPMDRFDHYRTWLRPDDRYWLDIGASGFSSEVDLPTAVATLARFYLLPAVQVADVDDADVVLSYDHDPGLLPLRYYEQHREGLQVVFVSRIAR